MKTIRNIIISASAAAILLTVSAGAADASAVKSPHSFEVDRQPQDVAAYTIDGNNYFKLRDIASILNGSEKQFEIVWDNAEQTIEIKSGQSYTAVGDEMQPLAEGTVPASYSTDRLLMDGEEVKLAGYAVNGNNFYKLRDVAYLIDFGVTWDETARRVIVDTTQSYVPTAAEQEIISRKAELYEQAQQDLENVEVQSAQVDRELDQCGAIQLRLNILTGKKRQLWEDALSRMIERTEQVLTPDALDAFHAEQAAWQAELERQQNEARNMFWGGSMVPTVLNSIQTELSQERIDELLVYLR